MERRALTLIELIVIVLILGFLMCLIVPGINSGGGREPARSNTCRNNLKNLTTAFLNFETQKGQYPGWKQTIVEDKNDGQGGVADCDGSWVVAIMPFIEMNDVYEVWNDPETPSRPTQYTPLLQCPCDPRSDSAEDCSLAYVVNCGLPGEDATNASGVFFDLTTSPLTINSGDMLDGTAKTICITENLQTWRWAYPDDDGVYQCPTEQALGFNWQAAWGACSGNTNRYPTALNTCSDQTPEELFETGVYTTPSDDFRFARPSSHHPGVVNVGFCDGHVTAVSDEIDATVYAHLMTPCSRKMSDVNPELATKWDGEL